MKKTQNLILINMRWSSLKIATEKKRENLDVVKTEKLNLHTNLPIFLTRNIF